jgi:mRNA interferase MazF
MTASTRLVSRFDIYWVDLDPTKGSEIRKTRPCIIVSPDEMNQTLKTVIVVPITSTVVDWPFRTVITSTNKKSSAACDQLRTISKERLLTKIGTLKGAEKAAMLEILQAIFSE